VRRRERERVPGRVRCDARLRGVQHARHHEERAVRRQPRLHPARRRLRRLRGPVAAAGGAAADMRAVVAYAKARGVRVLPEWDVPGHGSWGAGIPALMGCPDVLDPTQDFTYDTLRAFLVEMTGIFEDAWLFLGGDEVDYTCWDANPTIAAWLKAHGMTSSQVRA
jgi:hypothetical protein